MEETLEGGAANMTLDEDALCLMERKWWCFLLSSIITCLVGIFVVLIWRAFAFICCRGSATSSSSQAISKSKVPDNKSGNNREVAEIGFMTEAKDWAGELISGQSTTGRILETPKSAITVDDVVKETSFTPFSVVLQPVCHLINQNSLHFSVRL